MGGFEQHAPRLQAFGGPDQAPPRVVIPDEASEGRVLEIWALAILKYGLVHYDNLAHAVAARNDKDA